MSFSNRLPALAIRTRNTTCTSSSPRISASASHAFSTTTPNAQPHDHNKERGVSALRRTGLRRRLSVHRFALPKPVLRGHKEVFETAEDHGLWGFFNARKQRVMDPVDESLHGRPWTLGELRTKSWEDLHSLWWVCMKEMNRLATAIEELKRLKLGFGEAEFSEKMRIIKRTQKHVRWVLTERWYAWEAARKLAAGDESVDLTATDGGAYRADLDQSPLLEEDVARI